jgi:hypothetical protein
MDEELGEVLLAQAKAMKPDGIDIIGDLIDCYSISRFDKNPRRKHTIQEEIDRAVVFLERLRGAVGDTCDIRYTEGNHENRLERMLWGVAKHLAPLRSLSIPELMDLKKLGIRYYKPKSPYRIGDLWFLHGDVTRKQNFSKSPGGRAAADVAKAIGGSVLMGHTHQMGYSAFRTWSKLWESYEIGCMVKYDLEYIVGVPPWQQGWSTTDFTSSGHHSVDFIRVVEVPRHREVLYHGKVIATLRPSKTHLRLEE